MNYLDIILLILLLVFFIFGLKRGFLLSFLQLLGILLVIILVRQFGTVIREGFHIRLGISETWAIILGYIVIFLIVMILAKIISTLLEKLMALIHMGWLNRFLGGILNVVFGFAIIVLIVLIFEVSSLSKIFGEAREKSQIYSTAKVLADDIVNRYISEIPGSHYQLDRQPRPQQTRPI